MPDDFKDWEWQRLSGNFWVFGTKVRGIVRHHVGQVDYDDDSQDRRGGWSWVAWYAENTPGERGQAGSRTAAVEAVERCLQERGAAVPMSDNDHVRYQRALACDRTNMDAVLDAMASLELMEHPARVPLLRELREVVRKLEGLYKEP